MEDTANVTSEQQVDDLKNEQLSEIVHALAESQGAITNQMYEKVLSNLFTIVPDLETIQHNIRLKVKSKHKYRFVNKST